MYGLASGRDRAHLDASALLVADRNTNHRAAVRRRRLDLIRRLEVRVQPPVSVDARVEHQADVVGVREDPVDELPGELAQFLIALGVPAKILAAFADRHVRVHPVAVDTDHRFGQERRGEAHAGGDLPADQLVELDLVGRRDDFAVAVVDLELRRRDFGVVLLVLEPHGPLHFGRRVDERAQRITGERVVVPAGVDVLEPVRLVEPLFGVRSVEQKAFDLIRGVERVAVGFVDLGRRTP